MKSEPQENVGATLVVAPLPADAVRKPGDHKGRPYSRRCSRTPPCGRRYPGDRSCRRPSLLNGISIPGHEANSAGSFELVAQLVSVVP